MPKILVIDDEADILAMIESYFALRGYQVLIAGDGEEGLGISESEKPDIIILDLKMKCLDGDKFLKELRSRNIDTPVIVITGFQDDALKERVERLGVEAILEKPASIIELQKKIAELTATPQ